MKKEWDKLRDKQVWDEAHVREWRDVADEAKANGETVHIGSLFGICVEKNYELDKGDARRKFKGRVVFQGNNVRDQNFDVAIFQDLGSAPATMEAARVADWYGRLPGHALHAADAEQAYIQADIRGTETWILLPEEEWPQSWKDAGMRKPVCKLKNVQDRDSRWRNEQLLDSLNEPFTELFGMEFI